MPKNEKIVEHNGVKYKVALEVTLDLVSAKDHDFDTKDVAIFKSNKIKPIAYAGDNDYVCINPAGNLCMYNIVDKIIFKKDMGNIKDHPEYAEFLKESYAINEATITSTFAKHVADVYKKYLGPKEDIDVKISKSGETVVFDLKPGYNAYIDAHSKEDGDDAKKAYTGAMIQKAVNPYIRRAVGTAQNETNCKNAKYKYNVDSKKLKITITFSGCEVVKEET